MLAMFPLYVAWQFPDWPRAPAIEGEVSFVTTQELEDAYPDLTPKERENKYLREHPVAFLMGHGCQPVEGGAPLFRTFRALHQRAVPRLAVGPREAPSTPTTADLIRAAAIAVDLARSGHVLRRVNWDERADGLGGIGHDHLKPLPRPVGVACDVAGLDLHEVLANRSEDGQRRGVGLRPHRR